MSGRLTTHVLDTTHGCPAAGLNIELFRIVDGKSQHMLSVVTNDDGRCDKPLLEGDGFRKGAYELHFDVAGYFENSALSIEKPFLSIVPVRFLISDEDAHYHVPLLVSPYGYSTYRGS